MDLSLTGGGRGGGGGGGSSEPREPPLATALPMNTSLPFCTFVHYRYSCGVGGDTVGALIYCNWMDQSLSSKQFCRVL